MSQNQKNDLPRNVLRVDLAPRVVGLIHRGHVDVGVGVVRDRALHDRFEETHFVFDGAVYIRLTSEIVTALEKEGAYESYILSLKKTKSGKGVRAEMDLDGSKSEVIIDLDAWEDIRHFLATGAAMGRVIAGFLNGKDPQVLLDAANRQSGNRQPSRKSEGQKVLDAIKKGAGDAGQEVRKPKGDEPGGLGTFADMANAKAKAKTRKKKARQGGQGTETTEASEPKSDTTPEAAEPSTEAASPPTPVTETVTTAEVEKGDEALQPTAKALRLWKSTLSQHLDITQVPENLQAAVVADLCKDFEKQESLSGAQATFACQAIEMGLAFLSDFPQSQRGFIEEVGESIKKRSATSES